MKLLLVTFLVGSLKITGYQSLVKNTDSSPLYTSTGERTHRGGVAVSRDLLCGACMHLHKRCAHPEVGGRIHYGDDLFIQGHGFVKVNDVMGAYTKQRVNGIVRRIPITQQLDIWCANLKEEKAIFKQYKNGVAEVWNVQNGQ